MIKFNEIHPLCCVQHFSQQHQHVRTFMLVPWDVRDETTIDCRGTTVGNGTCWPAKKNGGNFSFQEFVSHSLHGTGIFTYIYHRFR